LDHALAVGAEIFRFTAAFLRGLGSFSHLSLTAQPLLSFPVPLGGGWRPPRASAHHRSPSAELAHALRRREAARCPILRSYLAEGVRSAGSLTTSSWMDSLADEARSTIILGSAGLPAGGRIPPGGYPSLLSSIPGGISLEAVITFSGVPGRRWRPARGIRQSP